MRRITCAFAGFVLGLFSVSAQNGWSEFQGGRWKTLLAVSGNNVGFTLLDGAATGLSFTNTLPEDIGATNRTLYNGSGVAAGDFDGDGRPDIVLVGLRNQIALYKNLGNWQFTNVTAASGIKMTNLVCRGAVLADITGDGRLDLLVSTSGGGVRCWINAGQGRFRDFTAEAGTASPFASFTLALADVDGNGTLDLYIANNRVEDIRDRGQVQLRLVGGKPAVPPALTNRLVFINGRLEEYGEPDVLLLNDGQGHFRKVLWTGGTFLDENGRALSGPPLDWGLSATFRDLNGDGSPDLYVCNDFWTPDRIWLNDGTGKFRAAPTLAFRQTSGSSMGVDMAYLDDDKRPEIFVVDMLSRFPSWRKRQMAAQANWVDLPGIITNRPQSLRNTFFHARSDGTYEELANYAGLSASEWAWQPVFLDVDLDGHPDLLITSGHAHDVQDRDAEIKVKARQKNYGAITNAEERRRIFAADLQQNMRLYPPLQTPIVAFRNAGDFRFEDVTAQWGTAQPGIHHGIALADFDGDGDLDFVVNNLNSSASLYRNDATASRVAVRLLGAPPNTQAIGAHVVLRNGATAQQEQEIVSGGRYLSGSDTEISFATGPNPNRMTLEVRWRDGGRTVLEDIRANRLYELREPPNKATQPNAHPPLPNPWFTDVSERLPSTHFEALYDDFQRQPLLPWRLSQLGPGVACGDFNGDGWEDIAIGSGLGGRLEVFLNDRAGGFTPLTNTPFAQALPRDTAGMLALPLDEKKDSLLVAAASYEDGFTNAACLLAFDQGAPGFRAVWRDIQSSAGPLAATDMDGDGNLDLFVGARVRPARWPTAGGSFILRRSGQAWQMDEANTRALASDQPVSAAVWTDLNDDGFPELVLAGELSPPRIFRNERGQLSPWIPPLHCAGELRSITNLAQLTGLWNSVNAADFDGDGKLDLILGNWGDNGEIHASPERPYVLFAAESGTPAFSILETTYDERGRLTPARALDELGAGFPFLAGKFNSYRQYSAANVDQVFGADFAKFRRFEAATLKSVILLNRETYFELRELPREAQLAPAFGLAIADFDLDGAADIFLAQNFFATRPGVPRMDAGRGLLLRGNGDGTFTPLSGEQAGVQIYGEQRGAAVLDFNHDGRPDLLVAQNGAPARLLKNSNPRIGVRVRLSGAPGNPRAVGSSLRKVGPKGKALRAVEVHSGAGYWSQDFSILTVPVAEGEDTVFMVRWPGGRVSQFSANPSTPDVSTIFPP